MSLFAVASAIMLAGSAAAPPPAWFPTDNREFYTRWKQAGNAIIAANRTLSYDSLTKSYGAVVLLSSQLVEMNKAGQARTTVRAALLITGDRGKELAVPRIPYQQSRQTFRVHYAYVLQPDGEVTHFEDDQQVVNPSLAPNVYNDIKMMVLLAPDLRLGSQVEYEYEIDELEPLMANQFWTQWLPVSSVYMEKAIFAVLAPSDMNFYFNKQSETRIAGLPLFTGWNGYDWERDKVYPVMTEEHAPLYREDLGWVGLSTMKGWDRLAAWYDSLFRASVRDAAAGNALADSLTRGCRTRLDSVAAVYRWVAHEVRYVSLDFGIGAYQPRPASAVLDSRYGDCKDKSALAAALLARAGIRSYPALVRPVTLGPVIEGIPSLGEFNHMILAVAMPDSLLWLDPTMDWAVPGTLSPDESGVRVLLIKDGAPQFIPTPQADHRETLRTWSATVDYGSGAWHYRVKSTLRGSNAAYWRTAYHAMSQNDIRNDVRQYVTDLVAAASIDSFSFERLDASDQPLILNRSFSVAEEPAHAGWLTVDPGLRDARDLQQAFERYSSAKRDLPLVDPGTGTKRTDITITLPAGYAFAPARDSFAASTKHSAMSVAWQTTRSGLRYTFVASRSGIIIPSGDYEAERGLLLTMMRKLDDLKHIRCEKRHVRKN